MKATLRVISRPSQVLVFFSFRRALKSKQFFSGEKKKAEQRSPSRDVVNWNAIRP